MLSRRIRWQLIAFVIVTVLGVAYTSVRYVQIPRQLGLGTYAVTLDLPRAAGLYENALVTYRGVKAGTVDRLELSQAGVRVVLGIDEGVSIPADSAVSIRSTSAIGEQYVNFEPRSDSAPMRDGHVIPGDKVSFPTPVGDLLSSVNQLAATVPLDKLNSTLDEATKAFSGTGQPLATLLDAATRFQDLADANLDPTTKLFHDLVPVLATQQRIGPQVRSFSGDLAAVTDTLRQVDPSLRGAIDKGGPMADELDALLTQIRPTMPQLLTDLTATGQVLRVYLPNLQHTLAVLPASVTGMASTTAQGVESSDGRYPPLMGAMSFKLSLNDPPPCLKGYDPDRIAPSDLSNSHAPPENNYCREPKDSPIQVRGYRNAPCPPGSPAGPGSTGATAEQCGWHFQSPEENKASFDAAIKHMMEVAARNPKTRAERDAFIGGNDFPSEKPLPMPPGINDPSPPRQTGSNGQFTADGKPFLNGASLPMPQLSTANGPVTGLQQFLLAPLLMPAGS
jgi:phospholipid/cholesterol/gamma-HCH transport system substrate-binding protein